MSFPYGHDFRDIDGIVFDPVKCSKLAGYMETVDPYSPPDNQKFLIAAFAGKRILGKDADLCINDTFAFFREVLDKRECVFFINKKTKSHSLYSANFPRLQIRLVSRTRRFSEFLRTRSRITSS